MTVSSNYPVIMPPRRFGICWGFFFLICPMVVYSHLSHGSSTTQCSCLISDSVNPFPLRLMSHEFTLLTPLHHALAPYLPRFLHHYYSGSHRGAQGREQTSIQKGLSQPADISGAFSGKPGTRQPTPQARFAFLQLVKSETLGRIDHIKSREVCRLEQVNHLKALRIKKGGGDSFRLV